MRMASQRIVVECAANIPSARCRRVYIPRTPFEPCRLLRTATTLWSNVEKSEPVDRNLEKLREARSGIHSVIPISDVEIDVVGQWTDIEGNFDYFCKLVNRSEVVRWSDGPGSVCTRLRMCLAPKGNLYLHTLSILATHVLMPNDAYDRAVWH